MKFFTIFVVYVFSQVLAKPFTTSSSPDELASQLESPLVLTPLIEAGKIREARCRSAVPSFLKETSAAAAAADLRIESNSGFFTVNQTSNANLFFWFFRRPENWEAAPVILWLNGGPGCSSLMGLFLENGPYTVTVDGVKRRKYSWMEYYNVLYVDSPIGAGFSYVEEEEQYAQTDETVGKHLYAALSQFYVMFPELQSSPLYVAGQSYAGKYIPSLARAIDVANQYAEMPINLGGMFIGNGYTDPENMLGFADHLHKLGLVDYRTKRRLKELEEKTAIFVRSGYYEEADMVREHIIKLVNEATGYDAIYDYVHDTKQCNLFAGFLQSFETREAIHVGARPFEVCSSRVYTHLRGDIMKSAKPWIEQLLEKYPIVFYNGQLDISVSHLMSSNFVEKLQWSGAEKFSRAHRVKWYVGGELAGYYKRSGNLVQALVRDAGHAVVLSQPKFALDLLVRFVNDDL